MAQIIINTTEDEQNKVLVVLKKHPNETIAVSAIAAEAKMRATRVRYVITDLEESGKIKRVPTKAFNAHYVRYCYEVL